jgi:hypothetical protein
MTEVTNLPKWYSETLEKDNYFPLLRDFRCKNSAKLYSEVWENEFSTLRMCILTVPGKFFAETVVIFPKYGVNTPIFGSEYTKMPKKSFGAVDFHPQNGNISPIRAVLGAEPLCEVVKSPHYDLTEHFSPWLWIKRSGSCLYREFSDTCTRRSKLYHDMIGSEEGSRSLHPVGFCKYMSEHDPARGILRSYFGSRFSSEYTEKFLFPESSDFLGTFYKIYY